MSLLHRDLIDSYRPKCPNSWPSGPDDGYFFQHLPYHLRQAELRDELRTLLLDFDWLAAKLRATDFAQLLVDFGWASEDTIVQVYGVGPWGITYVNPADDPVKKS